MIRQLLTVTALAGAVCCLGQTPTADADIVTKAKVTLLDGSQFFGTPRFTSFVLVMDFGKLDIPLARVSTLGFFKDRSKVGAYHIVTDSVKVGFDNKDILSGKLEGTTLGFDTIFNEVHLEPSQIKSITFTKQRDISRSANQPGLLLYVPLDMENSDLGLFGARMEANKVRIVEGRLGNAMSLESADARVTLHLPFLPYAMPEGTIEFWARLPQPRQRFSGGGQPWFLNIISPGGRNNTHFVFGFTASDNTGKGGLVGRILGIGTAGTHAAGAVSNIAETGLLQDSPDGWHHYALVWKRDGLDFPGARGRSLLIAVDGKIVAVGDNETSHVHPPEGSRLVIPGGNIDAARPLMISDLKIWNHAKRPEES